MRSLRYLNERLLHFQLRNIEEVDYGRALHGVEELWDCSEGSAESEELDILTTIEAYEWEHYPMDLPDPIEAIRFRLEQGQRPLGR